MSNEMISFKGKSLGKNYFLEDHLGEGAFGAVFLSQQKFLGQPARRVALKLSKRVGIDERTARELFADAFLLAAALDQIADPVARSHLVHVYDMGILPEADNRAFLVMEFVEGTDLAEQFAKHPNGVLALILLKWLRQICHALRALHRLPRPIIHRDLKPDNVLLGGPDRHVRVVDFGLAAELLYHDYVPGVAGTTAYMAPETMLGRGESRPASDVYSLGVLLYEGLTGKHPFKDLVPPTDMPEAMHKDWIYDQKKKLRLAPPSTVNKTVDAHLDRVTLRCLEFNYRHRYHDAGALLEALDPPPPPPPTEDELSQGRGLQAAGDLAGARRMFESGLSRAVLPAETRFFLLRELGAVLAVSGEHNEAADRLVQAWKLTENSAILRSRQERCELLGQIVTEYDHFNKYQANQYRIKQQKENCPSVR